MDGSLLQYAEDNRARVERRLRELLDPGHGTPSALVEAMRYSCLAPGKRLRPLLVLLAAEACGAENNVALPAACAVEMVHVYSLIHDDLPAMDDDDVRRGQPTCHKQFGEALAILAGDALLTLAFDVLAHHYPAKAAMHSCRELARGSGAAGMVGGQVEDLAWEKGGGGLDELENIHVRKTGALFRACLRIGYYVARGDGIDQPAWLESLDGYGRCFGLAFQITDDLLDIEGSADQVGKNVRKDAARGKLTYPGFLGVDESRRRAEELCRQARMHLEVFGHAGDKLASLAEYIVERKN